MRRLLIICMCFAVVLSMASTVPAIQYSIDRLETGNPGGPDASLQTYDTMILLDVGQEVDIDLWVSNVPEPLITAGFLLTYNPAAISIVSMSVYQAGSAVTPGPWDLGMTMLIPDPLGPGTYMVLCGNLSLVPVGLGGDIIMAKVRIRSDAAMHSLLEVTPIPGIETVVGGISGTTYDPQIASSDLSLTIDICEGNFDGDLDQDGADAFKFKTDFGRSTFNRPCPSMATTTTTIPYDYEPDLIIQSMVMTPIQPKQGEQVTIEITVKNQGLSTTPIAFWLDWYKHLDTPPALYQMGDQYCAVPILAPSATHTCTFSGVYYDSVGDFKMYAQVDTDNGVVESIEDNNVYGPYGYHVAEGCVGTLSPLGRWCDQGNGTVKDMTTGLVWLKDAGWGDTKQWIECSTWDDAHTRAGILYSGMSGAGLSDGSVEGDWRLPTKSEFLGITSGNESISYSQTYFFTNVQDGLYWTSNTYSTNTAMAWAGAANGLMFNLWKVSDYNYLNVWPVR